MENRSSTSGDASFSSNDLALPSSKGMRFPSGNSANQCPPMFAGFTLYARAMHSSCPGTAAAAASPSAASNAASTAANTGRSLPCCLEHGRFSRRRFAVADSAVATGVLGGVQGLVRARNDVLLGLAVVGIDGHAEREGRIERAFARLEGLL